MLNVGPPASAATSSIDSDHIAVSSTFHVALTVGFIPTQAYTTDQITRFIPGGKDLPPGVLSTPTPVLPTTSLYAVKRFFPGTMRTLPLPIVVGSVSEPRLAMHNHRWSDLHLDRTSGREVGRMVSGEGTTCEDGWILAPPTYREAIQEVPYVFGGLA